jgi:protein-tyrosine phosphatase
VADGERHIVFEACFNFRDLGGYETSAGRRVRWGRVFRSDNLGRFTDRDLESAMALGLRTVIDLRASAELVRDGRFPGTSDVTFRHLPVFEEDALPFEPVTSATSPPAPGDGYIRMVGDGTSAFADALRSIAEDEHAAVFHCAAGKDRTGIVAAMLLSTLGVPDASIVTDYSLSEVAFDATYEWAVLNDPQLQADLDGLPSWMHASPPAAMHALLQAVRAQHGSIEGYLIEHGLEHEAMDALRGRLLN